MEFDPLRDADGQAIRAFLQGTLFGVVSRGDMPIPIDSMWTPTSADGDYLNHFIITTKAGHRLRVSVEVDE